jgi:hypothetical protein
LSKHRIRKRNPRHSAPAAPEPPSRDELVADQAAELGTLWRVLPHALARDSNGQINKDQAGDRHASGAAKGSAASVNLDVVDATVIVETGITTFAAQAVALLRIDERPRDTVEIIDRIPDWYRSLARAGQPLARHLEHDLPSWLRQVRSAIRIQRPDTVLGPMCPDHRETAPTPLLIVGAEARLAASLLAGPPTEYVLPTGPTCASWSCGHESCSEIREPRLRDDRGRLLDWVLLRSGEPSWSSANGELAWTWSSLVRAVRCPKCRRRWATTGEQRILQRELAALGDKRPIGLTP